MTSSHRFSEELPEDFLDFTPRASTVVKSREPKRQVTESKPLNTVKPPEPKREKAPSAPSPSSSQFAPLAPVSFNMDRTPPPHDPFGDDEPSASSQLYNKMENEMAYTRKRQAQHSVKEEIEEEYEEFSDEEDSGYQNNPFGSLNRSSFSGLNMANSPRSRVSHPNTAPPRRPPTDIPSDQLNIEIDTTELAKNIIHELRTNSIPQAVFAERILARTQGTLSDLLRNPKSWATLKASGRGTYIRMYNWLQLPIEKRLAEVNTVGGDVEAGLSPPTPALNKRVYKPSTSGHHEAPTPKRVRVVFNETQKRTLQAIFQETATPSREMQETIAEHLRLDLSTVANFFLNARRRSYYAEKPQKKNLFVNNY